MRRRSMLAATAAALGLAGCAGSNDGADPTTTQPPTATETPGSPDGEPLSNASFEADWSGWTVGRDLPGDPNRPGDRDVASTVGVTSRDSSEGYTSLQLGIDGSQDDGTVWVQQPVDLSTADYLAVDYKVSTSFNHIRNAAVYAGPTPSEPLTEADFDVSLSLEGHDRAGWKSFVYEPSHDGPGLVAVGFSVVWETETSALLDNVRLSSDPPTTITPSGNG